MSENPLDDRFKKFDLKDIDWGTDNRWPKGFFHEKYKGPSGTPVFDRRKLEIAFGDFISKNEKRPAVPIAYEFYEYLLRLTYDSPHNRGLSFDRVFIDDAKNMEDGK